MGYRIRTAAEEPADLEAVRDLFAAYHRWLREVVFSERLAHEIADLPGPYAAPLGRLLLAEGEGGAALGVIGVRPHRDALPDGRVPRDCELKRLFVLPEARGAGLGCALTEAALEAAREIGYERALLTTIPGAMDAALDMYRKMGFEEMDPFYDTSHVHEEVELLFMGQEL
jgi:GNAT superfamily N-acetyltransferase